MGELIIDGIEKPWTEELEIFNEEFGFNVEITYKDGVIQTRNNCTEVHHSYESCYTLISVENKKRSAFESDIHRTGGTVAVHEMNKIVVTTATKIEESY